MGLWVPLLTINAIVYFCIPKIGSPLVSYFFLDEEPGDRQTGNLPVGCKIVAGLQKKPDLRRYTLCVHDFRRSSAKKYRPATERTLTCDVGNSNLIFGKTLFPGLYADSYSCRHLGG